VHLAALRKAAHRPLEDDVVFVEVAVQAELGQPDHEDDQGRDEDGRGEAHQGVVGVALHQCAPAAPPALAAMRPRGPPKYSRIQGWSDLSSSRTGAMATTCLSASTATWSVIV